MPWPEIPRVMEAKAFVTVGLAIRCDGKFELLGATLPRKDVVQMIKLG